ncbi:hypothetical protein ABT369_19355 [Dactylosporangium sp. NPDC000244]|uniref:hypothetical protein n=1 Tax=Dactylosporangium sp. NPDC000244 TaxID=3154365 RepID=UPI00332C193E
MTEQHHQPLDHAEPPAAAIGPGPEHGSAATQPLPSPAEIAAAAARAARATEVAAAQAAAREAEAAVAREAEAAVAREAEAAVAREAEAAAREAEAAAARPTQPLPSAAEVAAALQAREGEFDDSTQPLPPPPPRPRPEHRPPTAMIATLAAGVLVVGAVLVVLIGRIDRGHAPTADSAPQTFPSPQALVDYLDRRGLPCSGYEAVGVDANVPAKAVGRGRCTADGRPVDVGVYAGRGDVEAEWSAEAGQSGHGPLFMALGENWTIDGPADWTKRVADVMRAQFRTQP